MEITPDFLGSALDNLALITLDPKRNITFVTETFAQTVGYTREELVGQKHRILCYPAFADSPEYEKFWEYLLAGNTFQDQMVRKAKDGHKIYLEADCFPLRNAAGVVTGICKVCFDKTKQISATKKALAEIVSVSGAIDQMYDSQSQQMADTEKMMESMQGTSADNLQITDSLKKDTEEIQKITRTVHDISYHTNILAVNTALQAVRSTDNSGGFSVVAKEMRKLAKDVDQSSDGIRDTLQKISQEVANIDQTSHQTGEEIESALVGFKHNQKSLHELELSSEKIRDNAALLNQLLTVEQGDE